MISAYDRQNGEQNVPFGRDILPRELLQGKVSGGAAQPISAVRPAVAMAVDCQHGGKNMPAFDYLRSDETEALLGYLEKLAGVTPSTRQDLVAQESVARVGEHMVRGTCHICQDATGPGNGLAQATIPSLASIPRDHSLSGIVHQVQYGSSTLMKLTGAETMPAFPYFKEEEIAAAYFVAYAARK